MKKAWTLMSEWVRRKDTFGGSCDDSECAICFTCGSLKHWKELQAGHFQHNKLDFDERNIKPQCKKCNGYDSGRLDVYAMKLIDLYGRPWVDKLIRDARVKGNSYTVLELKDIISDLKEKLKQLEN